MSISAKTIKELREQTGAGIMDCKKALIESDGDMEKATEYLRKLGQAAAEKKASRAANEGVITSYIHPGGKIGVLLEVKCETDFVARTDDFKEFVKNIAMQIAAEAPKFLVQEDIPQDFIDKEKEIILGQIDNDPKNSKKPDNVKEKIVEGKLGKIKKQICLMDQQYIKDTDITIDQYLKETIGKIKENIQISRFTRYQLGEL